MYADDTTIYFNLEDFDPDNVSNEINNELEKITKLLQINKLSLNTQKTKLMVFHRKQKHIKGTDHVGTFMGLKCVVYYANYRSGNQSSKIQVVP